MRFSCNGCRVLHRGCANDCTLKSGLTWILSPDVQANVTLFLAKFYGRIGLLNFVSVVPDHRRPYLFRYLLYEACRRIVNPVHGSLGLFWSGRWDMLEAAVDARMTGLAIPDHLMSPIPSLMAYNIRHVPRFTDQNVAQTRPRCSVAADTSEEGLGEAKRAGKRAKIWRDEAIDLELTLSLPGDYAN